MLSKARMPSFHTQTGATVRQAHGSGALTESHACKTDGAVCPALSAIAALCRSGTRQRSPGGVCVGAKGRPRRPNPAEARKATSFPGFVSWLGHLCRRGLAPPAGRQLWPLHALRRGMHPIASPRGSQGGFRKSALLQKNGSTSQREGQAPPLRYDELGRLLTRLRVYAPALISRRRRSGRRRGSRRRRWRRPAHRAGRTRSRGWSAPLSARRLRRSPK